jgi:phosphatidylglycerophosphate synthase
MGMVKLEGYVMENSKTTGIKKYLPNIATLIRLFGSFSLLFVMNLEKDIGPFKAVPWVWLIVYLFLVFTDTMVVCRYPYNVKSVWRY